MDPSVQPPPSVQTCYRHPDQPGGVICQRCDRPICPQCMHQASVGFHCPECAKKGAQKVVRGPGGFAVKPILTQVLIAVNVAIFALGVALDGTGAISGDTGRLQVDFGLTAKLWQAGDSLRFIYLGPVQGTHEIGVGGGEAYRLITSGFLHYGIFHLLLNMYALWILGNAVERMGGRLRFGIVYGVSILAGSLGALLLSPDSITAGASGGIFGLMGAIFLAQRAQGIPFRDSPLLGVLVLNLVITFGLSSQISVGGHIGGLIGGGLAGYVLFDLARRPGLDKRAPFAICALLAVAVSAAAVVFASGYTPT